MHLFGVVAGKEEPVELLKAPSNEARKLESCHCAVKPPQIGGNFEFRRTTGLIELARHVYTFLYMHRCFG